jgi:leucyl aminopeptidase
MLNWDLSVTAAELTPTLLMRSSGMSRSLLSSLSHPIEFTFSGHSGIRVQIVNTDAEGRLVLADCLSHMREMITQNQWRDTQVFSCATLTGHAVRAVGCFSIAMDNGPAKEKHVAVSLQRLGEIYGDPLEVSVLRREDFKASEGKTATHDVRNLGTPTPDGSRGHQYAAAVISLWLSVSLSLSVCLLVYLFASIAA